MASCQHHRPAEAMTQVAALRSIYAVVFREPPYNEGLDMPDQFVAWLTREAELPGFDLVTARRGDEAIGFAYGFTMPAGQWWRNTDEPAPEAIRNAEKFAVMEWAVLPDHRGRGVGRSLMDDLLASRPEPWATLTVNPAAHAESIYLRWGWQRVATTRAGKMPAMNVLVRPIARQGVSDPGGPRPRAWVSGTHTAGSR
jgi:GNAT superfamily N-acetyltransferase